MLKITNLHVNAQGAEILKGIDLEIKEGEIHAIMGPNGAGKSSTHQPTILETIKPTHVHVIVDGKIVKTGDKRIIKGIIENGYRKFS